MRRLHVGDPLWNAGGDHTTALFKKHGMTIVGFWQPVTKPDTLVYILAYKDAAARDAAWAAFNADPTWQAALKAAQVDGQFVNKIDSTFMEPADFSPLK